MKKTLWLYNVDLQLFADGAGGAGGGAAAGGATGATAADAGQKSDTPANDDREAKFRAMIKGEYKDQYNARVKDTVEKRLKGVNQQLQAANDQLKSFEAAAPIFDILARQYGVEATDYTAIAEKIRNDTSLVEKEAMARGIDVQDYLKMRNVEVDNASMRRQMEMQRQQQEELQRRQTADAQVSQWNQQAEQAKQFYPGLDLEAEIKNPDFSRLLSSGVDVRTAFEVIHKDEILQGAMQYAAQRAAKNVTDNVIAGAARPAENGTGAQGAVSAKVDPSKFTDKQIREYRERVARGERITL